MNAIEQKFVVTVRSLGKDGCGNENHPKTAGEIRRALLSGLDDYESIVVAKAITKE